MPDGESTAEESGPVDGGSFDICVTQAVAGESSIAFSDVGAAAESSVRAQESEKDLRKVPRRYQLELCKKAMEENIIVYLGTGCGKTHIAVLLIYEFAHLIRKPQKNLCIFLAPTVALVQQQAKVIEESIGFKVGTFCGGSKRLKTHHDWEKEIDQYEVLVMIPQILLYALYHRFIKMELIALLIFDECHHAQVKSNHPYAKIMKDFYKPDILKVPRVFGMTASPVVGKGASTQANLPKSINSLENLLDAKVYSVEDNEELESFVSSPVVRVYHYGPVVNDTTSPYMTYSMKLAEIKRECISALSREMCDHQSLRNTKKQLIRLHDNMIFCLENVGVCGALHASHILLSGDQSVRNELIEAEGNTIDDCLNKFLTQAAEVFASDCTSDGISSDLSCIEVLKEPFFSKKLLRLIGILSSFRLQPNMKCIIFVNRIVTARSLSYILQNLKFLVSWKCHFLVGVNAGLKSMSRNTMKSILEKFRSGELNLLVATKIGEEGLDIQTCCLVIRFDLPETVASFIQSRGRARMPESEYAFLVDRGNRRELDLIKNFSKDEYRMNREIMVRSSSETFSCSEERVYRVDSSGALISAGYGISLLHRYCSKLPHDEFFNPKPKFYYFDDLGGTVCYIILPANAPTHQIVGTPQSSMEAAKKDACLKAIEELHKLGVLTDYLLPKQDDTNDDGPLPDSSDSDSCEGDGSREELHEMLVPAILRESWTKSENPVHLNSYFLQFNPDPEDRVYKDFSLFVKSPLPGEAEKLELDLHLARGRSVMTKLVPSGIAEFTKYEIMQAQHFQEMLFKVILDRSEFVSEFVPLGKDDNCESHSSTFYLLLPTVFHKNAKKVTVDWKIIRRCLSSPVFATPEGSIDQKKIPSNAHLWLDNSYSSISDVENSLVYARHKNMFYFVTNVVPNKSGYSPYKDSEASSHMEHLLKSHSILLNHPQQPLLHAKPLFRLRNLLHNRKHEVTESHELDEYFDDLPPELCQLKIIGFSKDIGSSLSLLPSIMHRLENLLVAIELKHVLSASFPEGAEVSANRVLEALTTEKCQERFSLERLEILGDSFLKYAVGRHLFLLHDTLDEGELTLRRSNAVNNSNLFKLATTNNLQVYIRDQPFDPCQFFALGHRCLKICTEETERRVHSSQSEGYSADDTNASEVRCSKGHHWLHKKTIADVVEALVGAFVVDSGFKAAIAFLRWIGIQVDFEASQVTNICISSKGYLPLTDNLNMVTLENVLGYKFLHKGLILQAFVHPSYNKHGGGCYQRLEFLGDAVLDYLITSYLYSVYPNLKPGQLTDLRSALVNNQAFANVAVNRSFHKFLIFDSNFLSNSINNYVDYIKTPSTRELLEEPKCPKVLGDLVESSLAAILLDTGFDLNKVWTIMLSFLDPIKNFSSLQLNPIRELQELRQSHELDLQFPASKRGKKFLIEAKATGKDNVCITASAMNLNKKEAIRIASQQLFTKLKAAGYMPKSKSLEHVLKSSPKSEARLIGYDETPIDVIGDENAFEMSKVTESFSNKYISAVSSDSEPSSTSPSITPLSRRLSSPFKDVKRQPNENAADPSFDIECPIPGGLQNRSARSRLYEICAANYWKPPTFDCCKEEGVAHLKLFTFRVVVQIEAPGTVLECTGGPRSKKKAAAEHAAEGAIWYLEHEGYLF
ncbi:Dicer-like protein [Melia azedarach]|uniref:Dicer-like protein n=1 Tax=Melia azedarach TaxID=155640 RepID=A0ACC1XEW0_MELAZ|nr:Dicer-like protein [Melia azedarach]